MCGVLGDGKEYNSIEEAVADNCIDIKLLGDSYQTDDLLIEGPCTISFADEECKE